MRLRRSLFFPQNDAGLAQVIRGKLHLHFVPGHDPYKVLAHFAGYMGQNRLSALQLDPEHCAWQDGDDDPLGYDKVFLCHNFETLGQNPNELKFRNPPSARASSAVRSHPGAKSMGELAFYLQDKSAWHPKS